MAFHTCDEAESFLSAGLSRCLKLTLGSALAAASSAGCFLLWAVCVSLGVFGGSNRAQSITVTVLRPRVEPRVWAQVLGLNQTHFFVFSPQDHDDSRALQLLLHLQIHHHRWVTRAPPPVFTPGALPEQLCMSPFIITALYPWPLPLTSVNSLLQLNPVSSD